MRTVLRAFVTMLLLGGLVPAVHADPPGEGGSPAEPPADPAEGQAGAPTGNGAQEPTVEEIRQRVDELARQSDALRAAGDAIGHARLALQRATELSAQRQPRGAERARQIAWAALTLASRQVARDRERAALAVAERRATETERRAQTARGALEHALEQRARIIAREGRPSGVPRADDGGARQ